MVAATKLRPVPDRGLAAGVEPVAASRRIEGSVQRRAEEAWLREFCEAALTLLNSTGTTDSILSEILPSVITQLGESFRDAAPLRTEYESWCTRSEQLVRLAALHMGNSDAIVRSVEFARDRATSLLVSLDELQSWSQARVISILNTQEEGTATESGLSQSSRRDATGEQCWKRIGRSILDRCGSGDDANSVSSQTVPSLFQLFRRGDPPMLQLLRSEWRNWKAGTAPLLELVEVHCPEEGRQLRQ